ncbi:hypothetical protein GTY76_32130 [Streptomyces sp. SID4951]|nr:hypothetical protein [Streptomyces sp. SID4951]
MLYGGESVLIQHDGEPLVGRPAGARSGGAITSMSTVMGLTASVLEELDLRPGRRVLDVGTGAGVTAAVACHVCGDTTVVTLDRDPNVAIAAQARIGVLGFRPTVVSDNGESGWPEGAPYDRIFVSFALPSVPEGAGRSTRAWGRAVDAHHDGLAFVARAGRGLQGPGRADLFAPAGGGVRPPGGARPQADLPLPRVPRAHRGPAHQGRRGGPTVPGF